MAAASVAQQLRQGKPIDNHHVTKLHLLVQREGAAPCPDVASALLQKARPAPTWVAARTTPEVLEVVMVWGGDATAQPRSRQLKGSLLASWLATPQAAVVAAFAEAGLAAWRVEPLVALLRMEQNEEGHKSFAGLLTPDLLASLKKELGGLSTWGAKDISVAAKAKELIRCHVDGEEDLNERYLHDSYLQAELLKRRGADAFVTEMQQRSSRALWAGHTLASACGVAAGEALPLEEQEVNGSLFQLHIMSLLAQPRGQCPGILICGPTRTGKSHVGQSLFKALPKGMVVLLKEAKEKDIYTFGTKVSSATLLLQLDECEARTPISDLKVLLDPDSEGYEVRTGPSKSGKTHDELPADLRVIMTSQWTIATLKASFRAGGAEEEDVKALFERLVVVDLYALGLEIRSKEARQPLGPQRVAATVAAYAARETLPFPRQPTPASAACYAAPPDTPAPNRLPHVSGRGHRSHGWLSDPTKATRRLLDDSGSRAVVAMPPPQPLKRRRLSGELVAGAAAAAVAAAADSDDDNLDQEAFAERLRAAALGSA